jgi:hypothetical protein
MKKCSTRTKRTIPAMVDDCRPGHACAVDNDGNLIYMEDVIMEAVLGRKLRSTEKIVFKNGDPLDCRRSNLKLVTTSVPD